MCADRRVVTLGLIKGIDKKAEGTESKKRTVPSIIEWQFYGKG